MKLIMAQFECVKPNSNVFNKYLSAECKKQNISLVVFGEYMANRFFKEYENKAVLKREFEESCTYFSLLATQFNITIVVPLIECVSNDKSNCDGEKFYKSIAIFNSKQIHFYRATKLMDFPHWNEKAFFDNESLPNPHPKEPLIFNVGGFKVSTIFGWETHFDEIMTKLRKKNVDILCVPTANTFGSNARWQRLLQTRSFLNSCFIVRVNRVGEFVENGNVWDFYGESFIALPDGSLGDMLDKKECIWVSEIRKDVLEETKKSWKFR